MSSTARLEPAEAVGSTLGRYRLERELGQGGMGVVHAAFDPDLQRRIALKVLRLAASSAEAKDRLLREARAMARLAHPNVVTVHEVGTANGRDYVAMELIQGDTLADWLRSEKRRSVDIVAAFLAAGRGLAAAHAAGIVHRDFKPHNVLRSRNGRIVVTDFGLAREAQADLPPHIDPPLSMASRIAALPEATPVSLAGITATGSMLGTPAYMAPEQWSCGAVTPATDQFAFCVALWEALAGERPYRGPTLDELRAQARLGPVALDASKIPRRLRAVLRRGLDPDPAQRWPDMDALLEQIVRVERRPGIALALGGGALIAASVLLLALRAGDEPVARAACPPPLLVPDQVWPAGAHAHVGKQRVARAALDRELAAWRSARAAACQIEPGLRAQRLLCLDAVLARIDAVARGVRTLRDAPQVDAGALLIDPKVCELAHTPRLVPDTSSELRDVVSTWLARTTSPGPLDDAAVRSLVGRVATAPCASALAHLLAADAMHGTLAKRSHHLDEAEQDAERCGDDRLFAESAVAAAQHIMDSEWLSAPVTAKLRLAEVAVHRVEQRDLTAQLDLMRVELVKRAENLDEAIARGEAAMEGFAARGRLRAQLDAGLTVLGLRQIRATPADLAAISGQLAAWRAQAVAELGEADEIVRALDTRAAEWTFAHGNVAAAHAELERLRRPLPNEHAQRIAGRVVDVNGKPVAGATVTAGHALRGDSISAAVALLDPEAMRVTRSGPDGQFEIPDAVEGAIAIAELGDRRSSPTVGAEAITLEIAPTSRLEGHVALAGQEPTRVTIMVKDLARSMTMPYGLVAPVAADGTFSVDGVPRHDLRVFATVVGLNDQVMRGTNITVQGPVARGIELSLTRSTRIVHVLVRAAVNVRLANAQVVVLAGRIPSMNMLEMNRQFRGGTMRWARQLEGEHAPPQIVAAARPGDLFATVTQVPDGPASACGLSVPDLADEDFGRKMYAHLEKIPVTCTPIPEDADLVTLEVQPFPRLD
ncbi:MAG TPA: protein kinase [Kofleriaceae bacterium]|nr:protein kinase [Kofleriaceae bacterium]